MHMCIHLLMQLCVYHVIQIVEPDDYTADQPMLTLLVVVLMRELVQKSKQGTLL
jgi:cell division inhibitor SulA